MLCEKRLYNVESVEKAALDVQVIGVDFPTVPFINSEVEELQYVSPRQWERKKLEAMARRARGLDVQKPRPKTTPYRTRPRKQSREKNQIPVPNIEKVSERNLLKCSRVSLTIQKERESLTTQMQKNPRLGTPSRRDRERERPSSSYAVLGGSIPSVNLQLENVPSPPSAVGTPTRARSTSAKPSGQIFANLPKLKQNSQKTTQKMYKTRTSQYAERVKAVRRLQVQAQNELSERLSCLNISINDLKLHSLGQRHDGNDMNSTTGR